jgi:hypothetical protein
MDVDFASESAEDDLEPDADASWTAMLKQTNSMSSMVMSLLQ